MKGLFGSLATGTERFVRCREMQRVYRLFFALTGVSADSQQPLFEKKEFDAFLHAGVSERQKFKICTKIR